MAKRVKATNRSNTLTAEQKAIEYAAGVRGDPPEPQPTEYEELELEIAATKMEMAQLRERLEKLGAERWALWGAIAGLIILTVIC